MQIGQMKQDAQDENHGHDCDSQRLPDSLVRLPRISEQIITMNGYQERNKPMKPAIENEADGYAETGSETRDNQTYATPWHGEKHANPSQKPAALRIFLSSHHTLHIRHSN